MATQEDYRTLGLDAPAPRPKKKRRRPEEAFQAAVIELAGLRGWRHYHPYDSRKSAPGFPDLTLVRGERLVFAELKAPDGECSPAQVEWLLALNAVPWCEVYIWRPKDWGKIESILTGAPAPLERPGARHRKGDSNA